MHFFWGGDMPRYSPPLPFRRGRAGCPCVLACPRAPGSGVADVRAGWFAQARAPGLGRVRARWPEGPRPCLARGCPCVLASPRGRGVRGRTRWLARPRLSARPHTPLVATVPRFSPACAPLLAEFFNFLTDISV